MQRRGPVQQTQRVDDETNILGAGAIADAELGQNYATELHDTMSHEKRLRTMAASIINTDNAPILETIKRELQRLKTNGHKVPTISS